MGCLVNTIKYMVVYMNKEKIKEQLRRLRDFVLCCKKAADEVDSILEDINELQWFDNPIYKPEDE